MTIFFSSFPAIGAGRLPPGHPFEVREGGPVRGLDVAARELDRGEGAVTPPEGEECGADAAHIRLLRADPGLDPLADRAEDTVGQEDAEEGADEGGGDARADLRRRAADPPHRDDDAEDRGDDTEPRHRVAHLVDGVRHHHRLFVVLVEVEVQDLRQVVVLDGARQEDLERVRQEE
jgi:hypothetical protein